MAADEGVAQGLQLLALGGGVVDGSPQRHEDRRVARGRETQEPTQGVQGAVDVAGPGAAAFGLGALHHGGKAPLVEPEDLVRQLDDDAELVVVLPTGDARAMRRRADLDEEDRRAGERGQIHREILHHRAGTDEPIDVQ